jgi:RNA polymerase sigma-70 factor (sigma-E family)
VDDEPAVDFAAFLAREQAGFLRFATALTGDPTLADDVVGSVLSRAWERWDRVGSMDRPDAYVRRMLVNEFLSFKRRQRRHVQLFDEHAEPAPDHAQRHADREDLRLRLDALPRRQRAAVVLRYYEGLSVAEIANVLDCADGTVRSLVSRALATLRVQSPDPPDPSDRLRPARSVLQENAR